MVNDNGMREAINANCFATVTQPVLDHFKCYAANTLQPPQTITLADQFMTTTATLKRPYRFCNPVDKNGEGITDPTGHLMCHRIRDAVRFTPRDVLIRNQFGDQTARIIKTESLCNPATKDGVPLSATAEAFLDHFKCYKAKSRFTRRMVTLADQFTTVSSRVLKLQLLCNPVDKNGEGLKQPDAHLACYKIKDTTRFTAQDVMVEDQFGTFDIKARASRCHKAVVLCLPSQKFLVTTTTVTTTTSTTTTTVTATTSTSTTVTTTTATTTTSSSTTTVTTTTTTTTSPPTPIKTVLVPDGSGGFRRTWDPDSPTELQRGHTLWLPEPSGGPRPYNCIAFALDRADSWVWTEPGSTGYTAATVANFTCDNGFTLHACPNPLTAANPCPGAQPLALFSYHLPSGTAAPTAPACPDDRHLIHGMRQLADGTWVSKNGQGPDFAGITDPIAFMDTVEAYTPKSTETRAVCCFCKTGCPTTTTTTTTSTTTTTL
jgi:hypothetical protein